MSTEETTQVLEASFDRDGLSTVTATKTASAPRQGAIYNPLTLAAATPVSFHPINDGEYLAVLKNYWEQATIGTGGPQAYSAHTEVTRPSWVRINPVSGAASRQADIPSLLSGTRLLVDCCSLITYLFTIGTLDGVAFMQHHHMTDNGQIVLQGEELLPETVAGVTWANGIYTDGNWMIVFGTDAAGKVYRRRKFWSQVGQNTEVDPWQYRGARGWFVDPTEAEPEPVLVANGPISYAKKNDREWLCVNNGTVANFYSSRQVDTTWKMATKTVTADVVYLQPQLQYNPVALPEVVNAAIPYVATKRDSTSGKNALTVSWGLLPV